MVPIDPLAYGLTVLLTKNIFSSLKLEMKSDTNSQPSFPSRMAEFLQNRSTEKKKLLHVQNFPPITGIICNILFVLFAFAVCMVLCFVLFLHCICVVS